MPKIYRFSLSNISPELKSGLDQEIDSKQIEDVLINYKMILRSSIDVTSHNRSISILVDDKQNDLALQKQLIDEIQRSGIKCEIIDEPEIISYSDNEIHENGISEKIVNHKLIKTKKKTNKHKHNHKSSHDHKQSHDHDYDCDHDHDDHDHDDDHGDHHGDHNHNHWKKGILGALWGLGLLTLSVLSLNIPAIAYYGITVATTLMTLYLGKEAYIEGTKKLIKSKKLSMNTLYMISTLTIIGVSIASFFVPGLPLMFEAAPLILGFWHIGEAVEHSLKKKVISHLNMRDCAPKKVELIKKDGKASNYSVKKLIPNDIIIVRKGQVIPVDGECLDDNKSLFTTKINGSPFPRLFKRGDPILAGMRLADDVESIKIRVKKTFQRSYLSRVDENIKQASNEKAPIEIFTNKILQYFIPALLGIAVVSSIIIGIVFNPALAIQCAISVLVSACPCALSLVTPLAVKIGMSKAAEHGVNFKNGKTLQAAASIDTVVFDLNGTLTTGTPKVTGYKIFDKKISEKEFLQYIALLESHSAHPIAKAICHYASQKDLSKLKLPHISNIDTSNHSGIRATIEGETFIIGNEKILAENGIKISASVRNQMGSSIYLVRGREIIGQVSVSDPLRSDAVQTINALKKLGKEVHICTGADQNTARQYAKLLGIPDENICAGCVGTASQDGEVTKTSYVDKLHQKGRKVAMIGDAANDAIAITRSDFGIAIKSNAGDEITQQQAGAVIQNESLMPIVTAFEVAKQTKRNIFQNLMVSLTYNTSITLAAAGLFVAFGFALNPFIGIALMVLETAFVLLNAYRFKKQSLAHVVPESSHTEQPLTTTHRRLHALGPRPEKSAKLQPLLEQKESLSLGSSRENKVFEINKKPGLFAQESAHPATGDIDRSSEMISVSQMRRYPSYSSRSDCA